MGRSKRVNIITSVQRPDASLFQLGSRINYSLKLQLMNGDTESRRMLFDTNDTEFLPCNKGFGYMSLHNNPPIQVGVPLISDFTKVDSFINKALTNQSELSNFK